MTDSDTRAPFAYPLPTGRCVPVRPISTDRTPVDVAGPELVEARSEAVAPIAHASMDDVLPPSDRPTLGRAAACFRVLHTLIAVVDLIGLGYVWVCALSHRRSTLLRLSVGALVVEGAALVVGRGNCPLGPLQRTLGDPVPLFELALPPRAAKAAVPVLAAVSVAGLVLLAARPMPETNGPARRFATSSAVG